jgi:hypothetical protein
MARSTPPQTPNRSSRSSAAWLQSTSTGQPLHHLTAIARWAASSAVHSSRVMGSVQRGRSPPAARDRSARLSPSVAVMGWPALGVCRHDRVRGVNTFRPRMRFNVTTPKAGGNHPGAVCADRTGKWGHRIQVAGPRLVLAELPACDGPMLTCKPVEPPSRSRDCRQPRRPRWITEDPGHGGPSSSTPTRRCCGEIGSGRLASGCLSALALLITVSCSADLAAAHCLRSVLTYVHNRGAGLLGSGCTIYATPGQRSRYSLASIPRSFKSGSAIQARRSHWTCTHTCRGVARRCGLKSCKDHLRAG